MKWLQQTFSSKATEDDLIKGRALNITRIATLVAVLIGGITAVVEQLPEEARPWTTPGFQSRAFFALLAFIAVISVADILARAITSAAAKRAMGPIPFATPMPALRNVPNAADVAGNIVAFRVGGNGGGPGDDKYLFLPATNGGVPEWINVTEVVAPSVVAPTVQ